MATVAEIMARLDKDGDGVITREELMAGLDADGDGIVSVEEIAAVVEKPKLDPGLVDLLEQFFARLDVDGNGVVSKEEVITYWGRNAKANTMKLFSEMDEDLSHDITSAEFYGFYERAVAAGYEQAELCAEVEAMLAGADWTGPTLSKARHGQSPLDSDTSHAVSVKRPVWKERWLPPAFRMMTNWRAEFFALHSTFRRDYRGFRLRAYRFLASPVSSVGASYFSSFILLLSFASVISFGVESTNEAHALRQSLADGSYAAGTYQAPDGFFWWNTFLLIIFSLELVSRVTIYNRPWEDFMIWVDVACYLPLVIRAIVVNTGDGTGILGLYVDQRSAGVALLLLVSASSLRLLKMTRYLLGTRVLMDTLRRSFTALAVPVYLLFMLVTFFGTLVFAVEFDPLISDQEARVNDVTTSWWMLLVTMTTVGYGENTPQTTAGRSLTAVAMIAGLIVIAMPLSIVGSNFSFAWDGRAVVLIGERTREHLVKTGQMTERKELDEPLKAFRVFDINKMGVIDYHEFKHTVRQVLGLEMPNWRLRLAWKSFDLYETNEVSFSEFVSVLFPALDEDDLQAAISINADYHKKLMAGDRRNMGNLGSLDALPPAAIDRRSMAAQSAARVSSRNLVRTSTSAALRGAAEQDGRGVGLGFERYTPACDQTVSFSPSKMRAERQSAGPTQENASSGSAELAAVVTGRLDELEKLLRRVAGEQAALKEAQRSTDDQVSRILSGLELMLGTGLPPSRSPDRVPSAPAACPSSADSGGGSRRMMPGSSSRRKAGDPGGLVV